MIDRNRRKVSGACAIILVATAGSSAAAGTRHAVRQANRPAPHASASAHGGGSLVRIAPPAGQPSARRAANGRASYGYGSGGTLWLGHPCWGGWFPWWGWPGYGDYVTYGPWYGHDVVAYDALSAPSPRGPAIVETDISPSKAEVVLDGESVGYAADYDGRWDELQLMPGRHTIAFRAEGYRTLVIELEALPAARYDFDDVLARGDGEEHRRVAAPPSEALEDKRDATLTRTTTGGRLKVRVEPPDAAVYLDGEYLGTGSELARTHGAIPVVTGTHRVDAVRPGYVAQFRTVEVGEADVAAVDLTLEHAP